MSWTSITEVAGLVFGLIVVGGMVVLCFWAAISADDGMGLITFVFTAMICYFICAAMWQWPNTGEWETPFDGFFKHHSLL